MFRNVPNTEARNVSGNVLNTFSPVFPAPELYNRDFFSNHDNKKDHGVPSVQYIRTTKKITGYRVFSYIRTTKKIMGYTIIPE